MNQKIDIYKAGGILIHNKKFLVCREFNKEYHTAPGGKLDNNEDPKQALVRELMEELTITVSENDLEIFGTFYAQASGQTDKTIRMDVFMVKKWVGEITPGSEIEEILWIDSNITKDILLGSIFEHEVLPRLKKLKLIN